MPKEAMEVVAIKGADEKTLLETTSFYRKNQYPHTSSQTDFGSA